MAELSLPQDYEDLLREFVETIPVIGRRALLTNKRASGRPKDLADVEALESQGRIGED